MTQKLKTNKSAAKRFSLTGTGKIKCSKPGRKHNTGKINASSMRLKRKVSEINGRDHKNILELLGKN